MRRPRACCLLLIVRRACCLFHFSIEKFYITFDSNPLFPWLLLLAAAAFTTNYILLYYTPATTPSYTCPCTTTRPASIKYTPALVLPNQYPFLLALSFPLFPSFVFVAVVPPLAVPASLPPLTSSVVSHFPALAIVVPPHTSPMQHTPASSNP